MKRMVYPWLTLMLYAGLLHAVVTAPQYNALPLEENLTPVSIEDNLILNAAPEPLEGEIAGYTTYDHQAHGPSPRRIGVDSEGNAHICWMYSMSSDLAAADRDMHYNRWDASVSEFAFPGGTKVSGSSRAGYGQGYVLPDDRAIVAFHEGGDDIYASVATEAVVGTAVFNTPVVISGGNGNGPYWPDMIVDADGIIHIVGYSADDNDQDTRRIFYSRSTDGGETFSSWEAIVSDMQPHIGSAICASKDGKVAIVYAKGFPTQAGYTTQWACDYWYIESTNNGASWSSPVNITDDITPDNPPVGQETDRHPWPANGDTYHAAYDENGNLHVVFRQLRGSLHETAENSMWLNSVWLARLAHWSEATGDITVCSSDHSMWLPVDDTQNPPDTAWDLYYEGWWGFADASFQDADYWRNIHRPVLAAGDGAVVIVFSGQRDPEEVSAASVYNHDLYATVSYNQGASWHATEPIEPDDVDTYREDISNITNTSTPSATPGNCKDEDYPSLWPWINNDTIYLTYEQDLFSGPAIFETADSPPPSTGYYTENPIMYLKYPWVGIEEAPAAEISEIRIAGSNIVSNTVNFQVTAPASNATLNIYDASGSLVEKVYSGPVGNSAVLTWNASRAANGIYFYTFETPEAISKGRLTVVHK